MRIRQFSSAVILLQVSAASAGRGWMSSTTNAARKFWWNEKNRTPHIHGLLRSIPALNKQRREVGREEESFEDYLSTTEVAVKTKKNVLPSFPSLPSLPSLPIPTPGVEFFYGITPQTYLSKNTPKTKTKPKKRVDLREGMTEALQELRTLRHEMEEMRKELSRIKQLQMGEDFVVAEDDAATRAAEARKQRKRQHEFEKLGASVEKWAEEILFPKAEVDEENDDGWTEVECNKMLKGKYNPDGRTRAFLKWMKDSRGPSDITRHKNAEPDDQEWPCMRLYSTIEAPIDEVCLYLSQEKHLDEYNTLLDKHKDLEEVTPHSKICWGQSPQILFIKPRDLITFCSYRWRSDGTQVVVNQACDSYDGVSANAFALRGATFICPDPDDPDKTRIAMLAHASPGKDVPIWACKTAIKSLAPIEPYRLFYKINKGVKRSRKELQQSSRKMNIAEMVGNSTDRWSRCPAGLGQMGYACFWPEGSASKEDFQMHSSDSSSASSEQLLLPVGGGESTQDLGKEASEPMPCEME